MAQAADTLRVLLEEARTAFDGQRGWQRTVADALGIHPSYVSRVLNRKIDRLGPDLIERLSERLGIDYADLYGGVDWPRITGGEDLVAWLVDRASSDTARELHGLDDLTEAAQDLLRAALDGRRPDPQACAQLAERILAIPFVRLAREVDAATDDGERVRAGMQLATALVVDPWLEGSSR